MTEHEIKDTEHSLADVMKGASHQLERERQREEQKARQKTIINRTLQLIILFALIGGGIYGYLNREGISEYMAEKKELRERAKAEKEANAPQSRAKRAIDKANHAATSRDSILNDIHEKGMHQ